MAPDVPVGGQLGQGPLELFPVEVQGVIVDVLANLFKSLEEEVDLAQVAATSASGRLPGIDGRLVEDLPAPKLDHHGPSGYLLGDAGSGVLQDFDLIIGQIVFLQIGDLERSQCARTF